MFFKVSRGVRCDYVEFPKSGEKYHDLVLHFIEGLEQSFTSNFDCNISTSVLFVAQHLCWKDAFIICTGVVNELQKEYCVNFSFFLES